MTKVLINKVSLSFSLLGMIYVLIAYPVVNYLYPYPQQRTESHEHKCPCGCQGDMNKCSCHKTSGIVGFRFCDTQAASPVVILSQWQSGSSGFDGIILLKYSETKFILTSLFPQLDDVVNEVKHPPRISPIFLNI